MNQIEKVRDCQWVRTQIERFPARSEARSGGPSYEAQMPKEPLAWGGERMREYHEKPAPMGARGLDPVNVCPARR
jgi:hypothetical protein